MNRALIVGCGYVGVRLARRLREEELEVYGTTRGRPAELKEQEIIPIQGDLLDTETRRRIGRVAPAVAFYLVPPQSPAEDPLAGVLGALDRAPLDAFVYGSSSSVYGDRGGAWVDETAALRPDGETGAARVEAERRVLEAGWTYQTPVRICRITGIYGPGRTLRRSLERGDYTLVRGHDTWTNRIHVDDLARSLIAIWRRGGAGRVYNAVDDEPHRASEFASLAAELQDLPAPSWIDEDEARRRYGPDRLRRKLGSKRVSNRRLREELEVTLRYPTYREGLPAAVSETP